MTTVTVHSYDGGQDTYPEARFALSDDGDGHLFVLDGKSDAELTVYAAGGWWKASNAPA